ncbi:MAG: exonuclease SbcCD subunit D [Asgard group archaeon]|nr:exonuclease SbcCD subunit D [Asgard group archaeon]
MLCVLNPMRYLASADTHLGYQTGRTPEARRFIHDRMFNIFEEILDVARKFNVDYVLHGGDIFNRSKPPKKAITRAYRIIENLLKDDIGFLVAPGNHERSKLPNTLLQYHPKCHIFSKLEVLDFGNRYKLIGFPYSEDAAISIIPQLEKLSVKYNESSLMLLCHQLFDGVSFGPLNFTFGLSHGAIDPLRLPMNCDLVITGHIHRAQSLQKGLIVYPGSTERTSFIEAIEPKGYLIIDAFDDKLDITFHEIETISMDVYEINLEKESFDLQFLKNQIRKGYIRTLLRFTGRSLSNNELHQLNDVFNTTDYPMLTIMPKYTIQKLKPLFEMNKSKFDFQSILKRRQKINP